MAEIGRNRGRGAMKSWLKLTVRSGVLDRIPAGRDAGGDPTGRALGLLARLKAVDGALRPTDPLAVEFDEFRRWVEDWRRDQRQAIIGGTRRGPARPRTDRPSPAADGLDVEEPPGKPATKPARPDATARFLSALSRAIAGIRPARPRPDPAGPLWDRWLDS